MSGPRPLSETLETFLEEVIFVDPRTEPIRQEWERVKAEENAEFERIFQEEYEHKLKLFRTLRSPNPEREARDEVNLLKPMLREEVDRHLAELWEITLLKVRAVLESKAHEAVSE